ncbi:Hypothetical predicted protein [Podarcis lilfordi]|uniref:Uncharacterized protein n=1 Tax=Podarcis lilfordi TaxID=74358 RepID=A0AA35PIV4_9SAUR|nr:Hypothetical predicted protein [Podarcis lilfordi]
MRLLKVASNLPPEDLKPFRSLGPVNRVVVFTLSHGLCWIPDHGHGPDSGGLDRNHHNLCPAHVESLRFHWQQHCRGADHLGRAVDELRGAEHRADAVQGLRLHAGPFSGCADSPCPDGHLCAPGCSGSDGCHRGGQVHQLRGRRGHQGPHNDCLWRSLHSGRDPLPHPCVLVSQHHRPRVLQPDGDRCPEEGAGSCPLHRLGIFCLVDPRRSSALLQLSQEGEQQLQRPVHSCCLSAPQ